MAAVVPTCLALVLCESVVRERKSGRATIRGVLGHVVVPSLPATTHAFSVWLQVTDGNGYVEMELVLERVPADSPEIEVILQVRFSLQYDNPNVVREHQALFADGIDLEVEGYSRLRLAAAGTTIMQRYFAVVPRP